MVNRSLSRIVGSIFVLVALFLASCATAPSEPAPTKKPMSYSAPPPMTIDTIKQYTATLLGKVRQGCGEQSKLLTSLNSMCII